jgi:GH24 family phage-related lysozyme (muramidase)
MDVSDAGLKLIAEFEGFSPTLYDDPVGHCTIGYGFLVHLGNCDGRADEAPYLNGITEAQGRAMLTEKVQPYAAAVERLSKPLTQHQFDALTSLCYNIGQKGYERSSVRTAINAGGDVCAELRKYVRGTDGKTYPGLVRRREAECAMFKSIEEEDEMWKRFNGVANFFTGKLLPAGPDGVMQLAVDFPGLPACKAVDLDVYLAPDSVGCLVFKDGDGHFAGKVTPQAPHQVIRVVPDAARSVRFAVDGASARTETVGALGYLA